MRVDLHVHTQENSDGQAPAADMIRAGIEHGLDGIVIADHHYLLTRREQQALQEQFPGFRVFRGAEVSVGIEHVLVIGGTAEQVRKTTPETVAELGEYALATGAFTVLAHPFWRGELHFSLDDFCPDAMDVASMNVDTGKFERIVQIARERHMPLVAGSDAHAPREVGMFHIVLDGDARDEDELAAAVRAGRYCIGAPEALWRARCEEVGFNEGLARQVLAEGGTEEVYLARGGHPAFFKRFAEGGSHMPRPEFLGLRNADYGIRPRRGPER